jgi:hypothetical protein
MTRPHTYRFLYILLLFGGAACRKDGCRDPNATNYNPAANFNDGYCSYRYLSNIRIDSFPLTRPDTTKWDAPNTDHLAFPGEVRPDVKLYLKKKSLSYWKTVTPTAFDVSAPPISWTVPIRGDDYLLSDTLYTLRLVDVDEQGEEVMFETSFIPREVYADQKITLQSPDGKIVIELSYLVN